MGKGSNASKIERARADAQKKRDAEGKGGGGAKGAAERKGLTSEQRFCAICKAPFMLSQSEVQLRSHHESKHAKEPFDKCFPGYVSTPK